MNVRHSATAAATVWGTRRGMEGEMAERGRGRGKGRGRWEECAWWSSIRCRHSRSIDAATNTFGLVCDSSTPDWPKDGALLARNNALALALFRFHTLNP